MNRLPIVSSLVAIGGSIFVMSEVQVPEKSGDNWIKVKTVFDPDRPLPHKPGERLPLDGSQRLFKLYEHMVAEQTAAIDRTRDAWEEGREPSEGQ